MDEQQKQALIGTIAENKTQQYMSAYLAGLGSNIHVGEKRARKLARDAGRCAMRFAQKDFVSDGEHFSECCQGVFEDLLDILAEQAEAEATQLLVPEHHAKGNNGIIKP